MQKFEIDNDDLKKFAYQLTQLISDENLPVFVCVGSDKYVCDSMAPIVGELLTKKFNIRAYVYGGLDYNINSSNLCQALNYIEIYHPNSKIFIIDASLGEDDGKVILTDGCYPAMGKTLPIRKIGQYSILGVVGKHTSSFNLNATRLKKIIPISNFIATGIAMALWQISTHICKKI